MKRFKYSLQRVLDVREVTVTRCEAMLAGSERSLQARKTEERQCGSALQQAADQIVDVAKKKTVPSHECLVQEAWVQHLADRLQQAAKATKKETVAVDNRRTELKKAMMEHKVIENLSRRERSDWAERMRIAEQKSMDEIASGSIERRKRAAGRMGDHRTAHNPASAP